MTLSRTSKTLLTSFAAILALGGGYALYKFFAPASVTLVGTVDANQVYLSSQTAGRLERLLVEEGQQVAAGDVIALLDPAELAAAKGSSDAQVRSLEHQMEAARATAASTVGETRNALVGAQAARDMAIAALAEATANRRKQQDLTQRMITLARSGAVTAQDRDAAVHTLEGVEAREKSAQNGVAQAEAAVRGAQARTSQGVAAQGTLQSIEGQLASARAQAMEAQARLGYTRVLAPSAGRIGILTARQGEVVAAGAAIATLVDLRQTWVVAALPENLCGSLKVGGHLKVKMPSGVQVEGRVLSKAAEADFATQRDVSSRKRDIRAIRIKLAVDNPEELFVPGMTAEVVVPVRNGGAL